jgi:hypothetical protein
MIARLNRSLPKAMAMVILTTVESFIVSHNWVELLKCSWR